MLELENLFFLNFKYVRQTDKVNVLECSNKESSLGGKGYSIIKLQFITLIYVGKELMYLKGKRGIFYLLLAQ